MPFKREIIERFEGQNENMMSGPSRFLPRPHTVVEEMNAQLEHSYTTYFHFVCQLMHKGKVEYSALEEEISMRFDDPIEIGREKMWMIPQIQAVTDSEQLMRQFYEDDRIKMENIATFNSICDEGARFGADWLNACSMTAEAARAVRLDPADEKIKAMCAIFALKMLKISEKREAEWKVRGVTNGKKFGLSY